MKSSELHIVLVEPEIPQNTGNIGRSCVGLNATLHLVGKLGFSLSDAHLKRAGLDYWPKLHLERHISWDDFLTHAGPSARLHFFSTHGTASFWDVRYQAPCYLVFGSESRGFPPDFYQRYKKDLIRIPLTGPIRSLNLSTAAGIATFEAAHQLGLVH